MSDAQPYHRLDAHRVSLFAGFAVLPISILVMNLLQKLLDKKCFVQSCPENGKYAYPNMVSNYFYYAWLIFAGTALYFAHRKNWSLHGIKVFKWHLSYMRILCLSLVAFIQIFLFAYWWGEVVKLRPAPLKLWNDYFSLMFRIAGRCVSVQLAITLIPLGRDGFISSLLKIDYDTTLEFHRWSGVWTIIWSTIHGSGHEVPAAVRLGAKKYFEEFYLIGQKDLDLHSYMDIVGLLAGLMFIWVGVNAFERIRRAHYNWFWFNHLLAFVAIGLSILHNSNMFYMALPALILYFVDVFVRLYNRRRLCLIRNVVVEDCGGWIRLDIDAQGMKYLPGQWASVLIPSLSWFVWHPFTIATSPYKSPYAPTLARRPSAPSGTLQRYDTLTNLLPANKNDTFPRNDTLSKSDPYPTLTYPSSAHLTLSHATVTHNTLSAPPKTSTITFFIKPVPGKNSWTTRLVTQWKARTKKTPMKLYVDGPHGTLPPSFFDAPNIITVTGGSGIPGALSICTAALDKNKASRVFNLWTSRDASPSLLSGWRSLLAHPTTRSPTATSTAFFPRVVYTGPGSDEERVDIGRYVKDCCLSVGDAEDVAIYTCGGPGLTGTVVEAARECGAGRKGKVLVHVEGYAR